MAENNALKAKVFQRCHDHAGDKDKIEAAYRRGCQQAISILLANLDAEQFGLSLGMLTRLEAILWQMRRSHKAYANHLDTAFERLRKQCQGDKR